MSFICQGGCGKPQKNGTYPTKIVVEQREKRDGSFETVKELDCCPRCKHNKFKLKKIPFSAPPPIVTTADLKRHFNRGRL